MPYHRVMAHDAPTTTPATLIIGCGYLGRRLAERLIASGQPVYGTTRGESRARELARLGVRPLMLDVTQKLTLTALKPAIDEPAINVAYMVPPGRPRTHPGPEVTVREGIANTVRALKGATVRRAVLVSSTAVYGGASGERVDADTSARPAHTRGQLLLDGENSWLAGGDAFRVLRLAGIYGCGRVVGLEAVKNQSPLIGDPEALLNLIHVEDAVSLLDAMLNTSCGRIEVGADGHPPARQAYYSDLAARLGVDPPRVMTEAEAQAELGIDPASLRRAGSKFVDPGPTIQRTGWRPRFIDHRIGLDDALSDPAEG